MPVWEYSGLDGAGKAVKGVIDADNAKGARARLRKQGVFPTDVAEQRARAGGLPKGLAKGLGGGKGLNVEIDLRKYFERVSVQDIASLTSQLSTLLGANIPMVEALTALCEQTENPKLKSVMTDVKDKVNEGATLAKAMRGHPDVFDDLYTNMVDAGEKSGALDVVLLRLTAFTEATVALRGKLVSALTYPLIMMGMSSALVLGLFAFVIPRIKKVLESFHSELPLLTRVLFSASNFVINDWWLMAILIPAAIFGFVRFIQRPAGRLWWHRRLLRLPIVGPINRKVAVSRFSRTLATLLTSGVPILTALGIVKSVVGNDVIASAVENAAKNISEGQPIAPPLKASGEFDPIVIHMITIGERTGELEPMLAKVADAYDTQVDNTINALTSLLTPILTIFMGGVVGIVALGVLLPMLNLSAAIK